MRYAVKKNQSVRAYRLGAMSEMERMLIEEGVIKRRSDGRYELFSQEAVNGIGQFAAAGDYFKVEEIEGRHYAYPNSREWFEQHHKQISDDQYEQINRPVGIWQPSEAMCEEIRFLMETGRIVFNKDDERHYITAELWGTQLSMAKDGTVVFYDVTRDSTGHIIDINFNFVARPYFESNYEIIQ